MHIPEPVMSLAITVKKKEHGASFSKALNKFQKEDPTFRVKLDNESNQVSIFKVTPINGDFRLLSVVWVNCTWIFTLKE